ncbi:MAG TPA: ROK family protein [Xanthobacteraceae bacterium]
MERAAHAPDLGNGARRMPVVVARLINSRTANVMRDQIEIEETGASVKSSLSVKRKQRDLAVAATPSLSGVAASRFAIKKVLVIDVGGTSVKILASGQKEYRSFRSGSSLTPERMVSGVKELAAAWAYDVVSIGVPGPVLGGRPIAEPYNLGPGWIGFDFARAFGRPVKVVNDAAMQALGNYKGGKMLFLGLGTGLGTAMIVEGIVAPMEVGHLPYKKATYEDYVGRTGLEHHGKKKWRLHVADVVKRLIDALRPDDTVIGGGNVTKLKALPPHCRAGANANAFDGGFQLWAKDSASLPDLPQSCAREGPQRMPQRAARSQISSKLSTQRTAWNPSGSPGEDTGSPRKSFVGATTAGTSRTKRKPSSAGLAGAS